MNATQFKQSNVVGVINRANELLESIRSLGASTATQDSLLEMLKGDCMDGDFYEAAALALVECELIELRICYEDPQVPRMSDGWNGGFGQP